MSFDYLGAISDDSTDYDHGEALVTLMYNQYTNLGSPSDFQAQASALWKAYNDAKVGLFGSKWNSATKIKNIGIDAHRLLLDMQRAFPDKMKITIPPATLAGSPTPPIPAVAPNPTQTASSLPAVVTPSAQQLQNIPTKPPLEMNQIPPVAIIGGLGIMAAIGYMIWPKR